MFGLNLFRRQPIKYYWEQELPSVTIVIDKIEELHKREFVYEELKITKATIDFTNHSGPVEFLKNNINLWIDEFCSNDYYLESRYKYGEGDVKVEQKDATTGKTSKKPAHVFIHTFDLDYFVMVSSQGLSLKGLPVFEQTGQATEKLPLISAVLTLYTLR